MVIFNKKITHLTFTVTQSDLQAIIWN